MSNSIYSLLHEQKNAVYTYPANCCGYYTRISGGTLYMFFRCSSYENSVIKSLLCHPKPYKNSNVKWRCHYGALKAWKTVLPHIKEQLLSKEIRGMNISGLGYAGALAFLCHEYVYYNRPELRAYIFGCAFGSPKVFYGKCGYGMSLRWKNFVNINSISDRLTKAPRLPGYRRIGKVIYIGKKAGMSEIRHTDHDYKSYLDDLTFI